MVTKLRPPAAVLPDPRAEDVWTWHADRFMVRVYHEHPRRSPLEARTYGPLARFDPHLPNAQGTPREQADGRGVSYLSAVRLLDLTGDGAMRLGAAFTLGSGDEPRRLTQRWGRSIYEQFPSLARGERESRRTLSPGICGTPGEFSARPSRRA